MRTNDEQVLTSSQREWVSAKAAWERLTERDILATYDVPEPEHLNDDGTARRCASCVPDRAVWDHPEVASGDSKNLGGVVVPLEVAQLIDRVFLPKNPRKMRNTTPAEVLYAVATFKALVGEVAISRRMTTERRK